MVPVFLLNGLFAAGLTIFATRRQDERSFANALMVIFAWLVPVLGVIACTLWLAFAPLRNPRL